MSPREKPPPPPTFTGCYWTIIVTVLCLLGLLILISLKEARRHSAPAQPLPQKQADQPQKGRP